MFYSLSFSCRNIGSDLNKVLTESPSYATCGSFALLLYWSYT